MKEFLKSKKIFWLALLPFLYEIYSFKKRYNENPVCYGFRGPAYPCEFSDYIKDFDAYFFFAFVFIVILYSLLVLQGIRDISGNNIKKGKYILIISSTPFMLAFFSHLLS